MLYMTSLSLLRIWLFLSRSKKQYLINFLEKINSFCILGDMEMHKWLWKRISETNVMEYIKSGEILKPIISSIPKPSRTPWPPPLRILLGIHVFIYWNWTSKFKVRDRKSKNFTSLRTLINSLSFFVFDLKYQMKVFQVELNSVLLLISRQEYSLEN